MSKKDYELIAESLADVAKFVPANSPLLVRQFERVVLTLVGNLGRDNPRFNKAKFIDSCGLNIVLSECGK